MNALLIPVTGPLQDVVLDGTLAQLQTLVGGHIEALPLPSFMGHGYDATAYIHDEGKFECEPNMRATDFMVPGVGLWPGDYIAGPFLLCGFDPRTGEHTDLPASVAERARLIEAEAA